MLAYAGSLFGSSALVKFVPFASPLTCQSELYYRCHCSVCIRLHSREEIRMVPELWPAGLGHLHLSLSLHEQINLLAIHYNRQLPTGRLVCRAKEVSVVQAFLHSQNANPNRHLHCLSNIWTVSNGLVHLFSERFASIHEHIVIVEQVVRNAIFPAGFVA